MKDLEYLKGVFHAHSIDEVIVRLRKEARVQALKHVLGIDKRRISPFTENDRWEDRD